MKVFNDNNNNNNNNINNNNNNNFRSRTSAPRPIQTASTTLAITMHEKYHDTTVEKNKSILNNNIT